MKKRGVIITGGAKRVGVELARYFADKGYDIALHYSTSGREAEALQMELQNKGVVCELFQLDLRKIDQLSVLMADIKKRMPQCSALINNASVFSRKSFRETDIAYFDEQMDVNFKAPFFLTQAFAKNFTEGAVVNIIDADIGRENGSHFAYLLSKKALASFTKMAARDLGPDIRVNGVCPGIMLPSNELDRDYMRRLSKMLPLRATPRVEQTVETAFWLLENTAITGQLVFVDGGSQLA